VIDPDINNLIEGVQRPSVIVLILIAIGFGAASVWWKRSGRRRILGETLSLEPRWILKRGHRLIASYPLDHQSEALTDMIDQARQKSP
jgi:hypothetical protein